VTMATLAPHGNVQLLINSYHSEGKVTHIRMYGGVRSGSSMCQGITEGLSIVS